MPADPKSLSELVAVHVMEFRDEDDCYILGDLQWYKSEWNPEHSITHAFEALEHWRAGHVRRSFLIGSPRDPEDGYSVATWLETDPLGRDDVVVHDAYLPRAICLALLKAKGVEVPHE